MKVKEIFENNLEAEKIRFSKSTNENLDAFEERLQNIETLHSRKGITAEFVKVAYEIQQNSYVHGFRAGVQLMADCLSADSNE